MLRFIGKNIDSVQPHGEPLITYQTFTDLKQLEDWIGETWKSRQLVGVEIVAEGNGIPASPVPVTDDIPF